MVTQPYTTYYMEFGKRAERTFSNHAHDIAATIMPKDLQTEHVVMCCDDTAHIAAVTFSVDPQM